METTTTSSAKMSYEKQEHLIKLAILSTAAVLCKFAPDKVRLSGWHIIHNLYF